MIVYQTATVGWIVLIPSFDCLRVQQKNGLIVLSVLFDGALCGTRVGEVSMVALVAPFHCSRVSIKSG